MAAASDYQKIRAQISSSLSPYGLEVYPFQVGWYNEVVGPAYHLQYPEDTLAFVIVSTPAMFDNAFKPYVQRMDCTTPDPKDPLDQCMKHHFQKMKEDYPQHSIVIIHDFEMHPDRRPKVLVQSAGHVAGAAYYYQRKDVKDDPWGSKKIYGISIHPKFGGWFAFRGVFIFEDIQVPDLPRKSPPDCVPDNAQRIELLERLNTNWQDGSYRDIIPVEARYSEEQKKYFDTMPSDRGELLKQMRGAGNSSAEI